MAEHRYRALFLCTGNSARSILAECLLRDLGCGRFEVESAGSQPTGRVHPLALEVLREKGHDTEGLRSKGWDEMAADGARELDFVFTVCDRAAGEACPVWPGQPMTAHWGVADPAAAKGAADQQRWVFRRAYDELRNRIEIFLELPLEALDRLTLQAHLDEIGKGGPPATNEA